MYTEKINTNLSNHNFEKLSRIIYSQSGIKIPDTKKIMVEARLRKRLRALNFESYEEYCEFLFSKEGLEKEFAHMIDVITTNKTDFFRESKQFDFLTLTALPELLKNEETGVKRPLKIWSAGCSTGEEPYTISIVVNEFLQNIPGYSFQILATDISLKVLASAVKGIYEEDRIVPVPYDLVRKYFLKSKDKSQKTVRIVPELRKTINFRWLNFMDEDFGIKDKFDIIFCRNVLIYFDKQTQDRVIEKLFGYINPGGYLLLGHSESIFNSKLPLKQLAASTYKKLYEL